MTSRRTATSTKVDVGTAQVQTAKHDGKSNFANCPAGVGLIHQNNLVLCFAGFVCLMYMYRTILKYRRN